MISLKKLFSGFSLAGIGLAVTASAALALSGVYIYTNNGAYYTAYGPSSYWLTTANQGYCGKYGSCSPAYMSYTWSGCGSSTNYALWDNVDSAQNGTWKVFVPSVNAGTSRAHYTITYNGASQDNRYLNQGAYSDQWIDSHTLYNVSNTWLDDNTCESPIQKIGFDEVQILY